MNDKHLLWMLLGCGAPLLLIFLAPLFGIKGNISTFIFIIAMFGCHLLMPMHHARNKHPDNSMHDPKKPGRLQK
ncbi:hypothetical protein BEL04_22210 [Mucilaginibacter sp. PPCGB 2223]|uniref:hypothetical protein n=1 Tax=Mucilaginibacter sp. PPCGB 2223 TaxID=1886027 RepID=UPI00082422A9|nr:hypothetical protein [Mucilaginibacter sp. PPCGB 2223]OCX50496.1 hypothetical protein BEL04_22210 [Mucilaginibacter sp. PPCGB 2223]